MSICRILDKRGASKATPRHISAPSCLDILVADETTPPDTIASPECGRRWKLLHRGQPFVRFRVDDGRDPEIYDVWP